MRRPARNRQSKARSSTDPITRFSGPIKTIEDPLLMFSRYAQSGIRHRQDYPLMDDLASNYNLLSLGCVSQGIGDEVPQNGLNQFLFSQQSDALTSELHVDSGRGGDWLELNVKGISQRLEVNFAQMTFTRSVEAAQLSEFVKKFRQSCGLTLDRCLRGINRDRSIDYRLGISGKRLDRRGNFVRQISKEFALFAIN
jgi:hypothetical protein